MAGGGAPADATIELYKWTDFPVTAQSSPSNHFNLIGSVTWTHKDGVTEHTHESFYSGSGSGHVFRFGGSKQGRWTGVTTSADAGMNGHTWIFDVLAPSNPDAVGFTGRKSGEATRWARQAGANGTLRAFSPHVVPSARYSFDHGTTS